MITTNNTVHNDSAIVREKSDREALELFRSLSDEEKRKTLAFMGGMQK